MWWNSIHHNKRNTFRYMTVTSWHSRCSVFIGLPGMSHKRNTFLTFIPIPLRGLIPHSSLKSVFCRFACVESPGLCFDSCIVTLCFHSCVLPCICLLLPMSIFNTTKSKLCGLVFCSPRINWCQCGWWHVYYADPHCLIRTNTKSCRQYVLLHNLHSLLQSQSPETIRRRHEWALLLFRKGSEERMVKPSLLKAIHPNKLAISCPLVFLFSILLQYSILVLSYRIRLHTISMHEWDDDH